MKKLKVFVVVTVLMVFIGCQNPFENSEASDNQNIFTGYMTEPNQDDQLIKALQDLETRGGFGSPDHHLEGTLYEIKQSGSTRKLTFSQAVSLGRSYKLIDANGSGNSLEAAKKNAVIKAKASKSSLVLVYMAQGLDYWNAEDSRFKSVYRSLINDVTKNGNRVKVLSHSWSAHIVADIVKDNTNITHIAYNPAHGNFKEGEKISDYVDDLKNMKATTVILTGSKDAVTTHGGGSAYKVWWGIKGYNSVYYAIKNNSKVKLYLIDKAGHGIEDMIGRGAGIIANRY